MWNTALAALVSLPIAQFLLPQNPILRSWLSVASAESNTAAIGFETLDAPAVTMPSVTEAAPTITLPQPIDPGPQVAAPPPSDMPPAVAQGAAVPSAADKPLTNSPLTTLPAGLNALSLPVEINERAVAPDAPRPIVSGRTIPRYAMTIVAGLYALGFVVAACRLLLALRAVARLHRQSEPLDDADWRRRFAGRLERLGLAGTRVELRTSAGVNVPLVVGLRRPAVIIPREVVCDASPATRDAVLAHELAHVARGDYAWQLLLRMLQAVLWFHPLVWHAERRIHYVRERVCDAYGVHGLGSAEQYADVLLEMASRLAKRCPLGLGLAVVRSSKLGERLAAIYERGGDGRCAPSRLGRTAALSTALIVVGLLGPAAFAQVTGRFTRLEVPTAVSAVVEQFRAESIEHDAETSEQLRTLHEQTVSRLQAIQDELTRSGKLDEAVAVREQIRILSQSGVATRTLPSSILRNAPLVGELRFTETRPVPQSDPGSLMSYHTRLGEQFDFRVTGSADGYVWGTGLYTHDSTLAKAAVHAGVLNIGQTGDVRVTILKGPAAFRGSTRHGVTSDSWPNASGAYSAYRVEHAGAGEEGISQPVPGPAATTPMSTNPVPGYSTPAYTGRTYTPSVLIRTSPAYAVTAAAPPMVASPPYQAGTYRVPAGPITTNSITVTATSEPVTDDPGTLVEYAQGFGRLHLFRIAGAAADGHVWGSDCYTHDSDLSTAAIHAGLLRQGQSGVVAVLMERGQPRFVGAMRNGVQSHDWDNTEGHYSGYRFVTVAMTTPLGEGIAVPPPAAVPGLSPQPVPSPSSEELNAREPIPGAPQSFKARTPAYYGLINVSPASHAPIPGTYVPSPVAPAYQPPPYVPSGFGVPMTTPAPAAPYAPSQPVPSPPPLNSDGSSSSLPSLNVIGIDR
jgi:beta-lactamase regulating signal transducer with metallopeptidase domain